MKFRYLDRVRIVGGFYGDQVGAVISVDLLDEEEDEEIPFLGYDVRLDNGDLVVQVAEDHLCSATSEDAHIITKRLENVDVN